MATLAEISCKPYWPISEACSNGGAMKELKMFPQITEETEENLLNLEEERDKLSSTPPSCSSSSSTDTPNSPNCDSPAPCLLPIITTEDVDPPASPPPTPDEELASPPARVRMRSLSGGAHRLTPAPQDRRMRRQSGDDVLSPSRRAALFEHFRPRSKSDSKGKRPTFLTNLRHSLFNSGPPRKNSLEESSPPEYCRQRSGSETRGGTMSKVIELFRNRSNSVAAHADLLRSKKQSANSMPPDNVLLRRHSVDPVLRRRLGKPYRTLDLHQGHADDETGDSRIDYGVLEDRKIIPAFLSSHTCYSAMPKSGKVIVLTTDLLLKNAFGSLLVNEIRSAPLWDSATNSFVGILTITDFINVLRHYHYTAKEDIHDIENQQIQTWRSLTNVANRPLVKIGPCDSLAGALRTLLQEGVHRLPVLDDARSLVLFVLTGRRLLQFLHQNLLDKFEASTVKTPAFMKKTVDELRIGTFEDIVTVTAETTVIEALDLFAQRNLSSLPILDHGRLVDIFAKFDVFALAISQTYHNLDITISEALDKTGVHEEICTCTLDETLETVIYKFVTCKVHRLVVVDEQYSPIGMISLSDVLKYLVLQASDVEVEALASDLIAEEAATGSESTVGHASPDLSEELAQLKLDPPDDVEGAP